MVFFLASLSDTHTHTAGMIHVEDDGIEDD